MAALQIAPSEMFRCERGGGNGPPCKMLKRACLDRQAKRQKKPGRGRREVATFSFCASGDCEQGKRLAAEAGIPERKPSTRVASNFATLAQRTASEPHRGPDAAAVEESPPPKLCSVCNTNALHPTRNKSGICGPCQEKGFRANGHAPRRDGTRGPLRGHGRSNPEKIREAILGDELCRCGCGRRLARWNRSGYSGRCNGPKYADGGRSPRARLPDPGNVNWGVIPDAILTAVIDAATAEVRRRLIAVKAREAKLEGAIEQTRRSA